MTLVITSKSNLPGMPFISSVCCVCFLNLSEILASEFLFLGITLVMFAASIFPDDHDQYGLFFTEQFQVFLEDGFKFVGVATWLVYFARHGYQKIIVPQSGSSDHP